MGCVLPVRGPAPDGALRGGCGGYPVGNTAFPDAPRSAAFPPRLVSMSTTRGPVVMEKDRYSRPPGYWPAPAIMLARAKARPASPT